MSAQTNLADLLLTFGHLKVGQLTRNLRSVSPHSIGRESGRTVERAAAENFFFERGKRSKNLLLSSRQLLNHATADGSSDQTD
jgi:hypothetical protein